MRYLALSISILLIATIFCTMVIMQLEKTADEIYNVLEKAYSYVDLKDWESVILYTQKAQSLWNDHNGLWGVSLRHAETESITVGFKPLLEYAHAEDESGYASQSAEVRAYIRHLIEAEKPYYYNILAAFPRVAAFRR